MNIAKIRLTQGNLNNNHFYLASCLGLFPADSIGGGNVKSRANRLLQIKPVGGESLETDIDGEKNIFRKRDWVGAMFRRSNAKLGDFVFIKKLDDSSYEIGIDKLEGNT
jgi:hypothetical protein